MRVGIISEKDGNKEGQGIGGGGGQPPLEFGYYPDDGYIDYSEIDLNALYQDTGFECKADFDDSIRKTAAWLKSQEELLL